MTTVWSRIAGPLAVLIAGAALIGFLCVVGRDVDHASAAPPPSAEHELRWKKVYKDLKVGDLDKAEQQLDKLLAEDPLDQEAREMLERVRAARMSGD
jgi:hypothetical protein